MLDWGNREGSPANINYNIRVLINATKGEIKKIHPGKPERICVGFIFLTVLIECC